MHVHSIERAIARVQHQVMTKKDLKHRILRLNYGWGSSGYSKTNFTRVTSKSYPSFYPNQMT